MTQPTVRKRPVVGRLVGYARSFAVWNRSSTVPRLGLNANSNDAATLRVKVAAATRLVVARIDRLAHRPD